MQQQAQFSFIGEMKSQYLEDARATAKRLLRFRPYITTDDIWQNCPPPKTVNSKIMGQVFRHRDFKGTGEFTPTRRASSHGRYIQRFALRQG